MSYGPDQQLEQQSPGQADWDTLLGQNFTILERGYHTVARVGIAVDTADVLWMNSGGFFFKFDPNSLATKPNALALVAANSGESMQVLLVGIARSLGAYVPGRDYYVSSAGGVIVTSPNAFQIGHGVADGGLFFNPRALVATSFDLSSLAVPTAIHSYQVRNTTSWGINTADYSHMAPYVLTHSMGASDVSTFYLQPASIAPVPVGAQIDFVKVGSASVTFAVASTNVILRSVNSLFKVVDRYSFTTLLKRDDNVWYLGGNITSLGAT